MKKTIKNLLFSLLLAVTLLNSTTANFSGTTSSFDESLHVPPLSFDDNYPDNPFPF